MGARRPTGGAPGAGQFSSAPEAERDWGSARGAKFVPAPAAPVGGGMRREGSGGGFRREEAPHNSNRDAGMGPSVADDASAWRSSKPLVQAQAPAQGQGQGQQGQGQQGVSTPGLADTETTVSVFD
jgi:translation initiation factor 4B